VPPSETVKIGPFRTNPRVNVYGIVMLLVMYSVWTMPQPIFDVRAYLTLVVASFMMLLAVALSHLLSESLDLQIRRGKHLAWTEHRKLMVENSEFLLAIIPVALLLLIPLLFHMPVDAGANELIIVGLLGLFAWGVYAGKRIGYGPVARWTYGLTYLAVGLIVVTLKVVATH